MYNYTLCVAIVLAQAGNALPPNHDPLNGNSGWVGTGLLGTVLAWLLFVHLPAKDKLLKETHENKDEHLRDLTTNKDKQLHELTERYEKKLEQTIEAFKQQGQETKTEFRNALNSIIDHCRTETSELIAAFHKEMTFLMSHIRPLSGGAPAPPANRGGKRPGQSDE